MAVKEMKRIIVYLKKHGESASWDIARELKLNPALVQSCLRGLVGRKKVKCWTTTYNGKRKKQMVELIGNGDTSDIRNRWANRSRNKRLEPSTN